MSKRESQVLTTIIGEDSNSIVHELVYRYSASVGAGAGGQDFDLQITDPEDPLLLFDYKLTAAEFTSFRDDQELLCEFSAFPSFLADKLRDCVERHEQQAVIDKRSESRPYLLLQEKTRYRLLTHLKLALIPASDARLKAYLAHEARQFKAAFLDSQRQVAEMQSKLESVSDHTKKQLRRVEQRFVQQGQEYEDTVAGLQNKYEAMLEEQRLAMTAKQSEQAALYEGREQALLTKYDAEIGDLRAEVADLTSENGRLVGENERLDERIRSLEAVLTDTKQRLESAHSDNKLLQAGNGALMTQNSGLQSDLSSMTAKWEAVTAALEQKSQQVVAAGVNADELKGVIAKREVEIRQLQVQAAEYAEKAKDRDWIAEKSKKVIAKHQEDIKKLVQHHNDRKAAWEAHMEEMKQVQLKNVRLEETIKALQLSVDRANAQIDEFRDRNEALQNAMERSEKEQLELRQMISYLEKKANEKELEGRDDDSADGERRSPNKGLQGFLGTNSESTPLFDRPIFY
jgi:chromosome segregation ATPase